MRQVLIMHLQLLFSSLRWPGRWRVQLLGIHVQRILGRVLRGIAGELGAPARDSATEISVGSGVGFPSEVAKLLQFNALRLAVCGVSFVSVSFWHHPVLARAGAAAAADDDGDDDDANDGGPPCYWNPPPPRP